MRILPRRRGQEDNAFGLRSLGDTAIGRLALFGVNEKRFCIGFALVLVPLPMASPTTPVENPMGENQTARISLTAHFFVTRKAP